MSKVTIEVTEEQARLISNALDFYSRVGIGQFSVIKDHPTFEQHLFKEFAKKGKLSVGDSTMRGEVVEIGKDYIKTKGYWGNGEEIREWKDVENIHHITDWSKYHSTREEIDNQLNIARDMLYNSKNLGKNGNWGINNTNVDESCREAYDLHQVIRHEFWKNNPNKSDLTVDSSVYFTAKDGDKIKIKIENE